MKKTILFLSLCTLALSSQVVHADVENVAPQNVVATDVANTGEQQSVEEGNTVLEPTLANVTGENTGETSQPSSTDAEPLSPLASQEKEDIAIPAQEVAVSEDSSAEPSTVIEVSNDFEQSTITSTTSSTETSTVNDSSSSVTSSMVPSNSTSTSTRSISSTTTETSTAASSTQGETRLRSMPRSTSLSGNISVSNVNAQLGSFDVRVTNVSSPKEIVSVVLPTWSQSSDLRWYEGVRQSDGSYKLTVNKKDHQYRTGTYTVHLYYKDSNGDLTGVGGTTTYLSEVKPTGTLTIENRNDAKGTFDVRVTDISSPKDISSVVLPTWSHSSDLRWYEGVRQSDGSYKLTVNKKDHQYRTGTYTVHLYYKDSSGGLTGVGGTTTHLSEVKPTGTLTIENRNDAKGTFDVRVTNISSPKDISSVVLPTWSHSSDLHWYEGVRQSDGSYKLTV
ncbi:TPA: GBS Bsp-like repeat-containing protein, partial [Streptococcus suis]